MLMSAPPTSETLASWRVGALLGSLSPIQGANGDKASARSPAQGMNVSLWILLAIMSVFINS